MKAQSLGRRADGFGRPWVVAVAAGASLLLASATVTADDEEDDDYYEEEAEAEVEAEDSDGHERGESDHDGHVGSLALGFLGTRFVPAAQPHPTAAVVLTPEGNATVTIEPDEVTVPLFGMRYWINDTVGAELAFGFNVGGGDETIESPNADPTLSQSSERALPSTKAFCGRLGVPLSVFSSTHYNFMLIPELDVGYTSSTLEDFELSTTGEALDLQLSGFVFGVGGRVGAELSFGFIDVPQLSIQSAWGLRFESRRRAGRIGDAETVQKETAFGTSLMIASQMSA
jgi:hypothetical protein